METGDSTNLCLEQWPVFCALSLLCLDIPTPLCAFPRFLCLRSMEDYLELYSVLVGLLASPPVECELRESRGLGLPALTPASAGGLGSPQVLRNTLVQWRDLPLAGPLLKPTVFPKGTM